MKGVGQEWGLAMNCHIGLLQTSCNLQMECHSICGLQVLEVQSVPCASSSTHHGFVKSHLIWWGFLSEWFQVSNVDPLKLKKCVPSCEGVEFLMSVRSVLRIKSGSIVLELVSHVCTWSNFQHSLCMCHSCNTSLQFGQTLIEWVECWDCVSGPMPSLT